MYIPRGFQNLQTNPLLSELQPFIEIYTAPNMSSHFKLAKLEETRDAAAGFATS